MGITKVGLTEESLITLMENSPLAVTAKTRYSQTEAAGILYPEADGGVRVEFDAPQRAAAAGQSLVCYQGEAVVGGGIIAGTGPQRSLADHSS